ncbi:MAG: hypothetical protein FWG84_10650 [Bacteroidales bacterium]|nr:hypothetical protein [Bacteroidales bacterium]
MKKVIIILGLLVATSYLSAQTSVWKVNWDMNAPLGQTTDFIGKFSMRGVSVEGSWFLNDNIALGGIFAWGLFYEKTGMITEHAPGYDITGHQWRYHNFTPLLFTGEYYFGTAGNIRPYAGLGAGVSFNETAKYIGLHELYSKEWMFTLAPEAGVMIPIANNVNAHVKAKYLHGFGKDADLQTFAISVGLAFTSYKY